MNGIRQRKERAGEQEFERPMMFQDWDKQDVGKAVLIQLLFVRNELLSVDR